MSVLSLHRRITQALDELPVEVLSLQQVVGHSKLRVKYQGREKTFTVASTPTVPEHTVAAVVRDVKRFMKGQYR